MWVGSIFYLRPKITSWACLLGSGLKIIFYWKAQSLTSSSHHLTLLQKCLHVEQLIHHQQKGFPLEVKLSDKSFIQFNNNNAPRTYPCGTPSWILARDKFWPLSTIFCFLKKSENIWKSSPEISFCFNLEIRPLCQVLDMSKKTLITSNPLSKDIEISWIIDNSWLMLESPG